MFLRIFTKYDCMRCICNKYVLKKYKKKLIYHIQTPPPFKHPFSLMELDVCALEVMEMANIGVVHEKVKLYVTHLIQN